MSEVRSAPETEKRDLQIQPGRSWDIWKENFRLWAFSFAKVRMLFFLRPRMVEASLTRCIVKIPLRWRSKNHLNSMYFGAICAGVDAAGGFLALKVIVERKAQVSLVFKDIHGEFLKRAESDVYFLCEDGPKISRMLDETLSSGARVGEPIAVNAYVKTGEREYEQVARFTATMSLKKR